MGCCFSNQSGEIPKDDGPTELAPNAASPKSNISRPGSDAHRLRMASPAPESSASSNGVQVSLPTGTDVRQFESSSGRATGWAETMPIRPRGGGCNPTHGGSTRSPQAEAASFPQDLSGARSEKGVLGQRVGPRNTDRNGTAPGRPKSPSVDSPHRSIPKARSLTDVGRFNLAETPAQAPFPPPPSAHYRRRSVSVTTDETLESQRHSSSIKQSAPGGSPPASTNPKIKFSHPSNHSTVRIRPRLGIDELRDGLLSADGKRSERLDVLDRTGQLTGRTKATFTGPLSDVSQAKLGNRVVAVKALRVGNIEGSEGRIWKRLAREIYVWAALDHPNVLELLGFAIEDEKPCLISPWCDNGTLPKYLLEFPDADRRRLVREIAEGLRYLHLQTPPTIHGDLKMTNVFVTGDHVAQISDFGTSRRVELIRTGFTTDGLLLATIRYTAPEILRDGQHPSMSSDVFSFACVALETMTDKCPFWEILNVVQVINEVVFKKQTPSPKDHSGMEDTIWELLRRCWNYEPSDRPHMVDVCKMLAGVGCGPSSFDPPPRAGPSITSHSPTPGGLPLDPIRPYVGIDRRKLYDATGWLL